MNQLPHSLKATVKEIDDKGVRLRLEGGQEISWPKHKLAKVQTGDTIELIALSKHDVETERAAIAKQVLHYMLTGDEGSL